MLIPSISDGDTSYMYCRGYWHLMVLPLVKSGQLFYHLKLLVTLFTVHVMLTANRRCVQNAFLYSKLDQDYFQRVKVLSLKYLMCNKNVHARHFKRHSRGGWNAYILHLPLCAHLNKDKIESNLSVP